MNILMSATRRCSHLLSVASMNQLIASNKIVAFIHGTPELPLCHKSKMVVETLKYYKKEFTYVNLIENQAIGEELISRYPFTPQVFSGGNLLGGAYSLIEFHQNGNLANKL